MRLLGHGGEAAVPRGRVGPLRHEYGSLTGQVRLNPDLLDIGQGPNVRPYGDGAGVDLLDE